MKKVILFALLLAACPKVNTPLVLPVIDAGQSGEGEGETQCLVESPNESCSKLRTMICTKVATCSLTPFKKCELEFDPERTCEQSEISKVEQCTDEFADIKCNEDLPGSCLQL